MTRKRSLHNLRQKARRQQSSWWGRLQDELLFVYLSGARGINSNFLLPANFAGRAKNPLVVPDSNHILYGYDATSFNTLGSNDYIDLGLIDRAKVKAVTQGGGDSGIPYMQPCKIDGNDHYVLVMSTDQENDLRRNANNGQWIDIQKAAATHEGRDNPLFKDCLGMYNDVILHSSRNAIRFNNAGAGGNVEAARALFLGSQAAVVAFGSPGTNLRFDWHEETRDDGDKVVISSSAIFGTRKVSFDTQIGMQDFGVFALDTVIAKSPTTSMGL